MIDVTVKTLDSQNHVFSVEEEITVIGFKERISPTIGIPVDQQRLIFRGRVLQNDKKISEYNVANSVVHVVQRPANQNSTANDEPRPSNQTGNRSDGDILFAADGVTIGGGGGRNAIIMSAIGLPTIDINDDTGAQQIPRRSGAAFRLMLGNQMLNRASTLLQQLEDDDAVLAAASSISSSSEQNSLDNESSSGNDTLMDIDEDTASIERMISQVVNVSSAAGLVAAIRQVQGPGGAGPSTNFSNLPSNNNTTSETPASAPANMSSEPRSESQPNVERRPEQALQDMLNHYMRGSVQDGNPPAGFNPMAAFMSGRNTGPNTNSSNPTQQPSGNNQATDSSSSSQRTNVPPNGNQSSPERRSDPPPRLRELATALQDLLALNDRLTPFLRFVQDALRQNRLYTEAGESQSTQFVFDTISSIMHLLSHSMHAFSDIMCDFSVTPDERRLTAPSSILVEQSTVVRATIPVAVPAAAMLGAAAAGGNNNNPSFSFSMNPNAGNVGVQPQPHAAGGNNNNPSVSFSMNPPMGTFGPAWRNPNLPNSNSTTNSNNATATPVPPTSNTQESAPASNPSNIGMQNQPIPGLNIQGGIGILPPGLQNLGALLGAAGGQGMMNIFGSGGPIPVNIRPPNNVGTNQQQQPSASVSSDQTANASTSSGRATPRSQGQNNNNNNGTSENNNNNGGMFQNLQQIRNELMRSQFDILLPCNTHHSGQSRSNRTRPAEFRRFVNIDPSDGSVPLCQGSAEGEAVEVILDVIRNSRIVDMLQPIIKDVVLNYLMRGRDPKNDAHIKTCAKRLVKTILPFFEKFSNKMTNQNESVDIPETYTNILTGFIARLMQKALGQTPGGDRHFKSELLDSFVDLQKQLIQAFKVCYPSSNNVGLLFVNYLVEQCLGGMSVVFKKQVCQKLVDHLKDVERTCDTANTLIDSSVVVLKPTVTSTPEVPVVPVATSSLASSASISSRCAASFSGAQSQPGELPSSSVLPPGNKKESLLNTDDVDIDEVLQLPPSMAQASETPTPRRPGGTSGHTNQTDSISSHMESLPSEWTDTVRHDIRRQVDMPSQQAFSPGYNTLFPRKH